jgi:hypothetical protein
MSKIRNAENRWERREELIPDCSGSSSVPPAAGAAHGRERRRCEVVPSTSRPEWQTVSKILNAENAENAEKS